jgi:hypothetical protein
LHKKPNAEVHPGHELTGLEEQQKEEEIWPIAQKP